MHVKGSWDGLVQRFHRAYVASHHKKSVELTLPTNMPTNCDLSKWPTNLREYSTIIIG